MVCDGVVLYHYVLRCSLMFYRIFGGGLISRKDLHLCLWYNTVYHVFRSITWYYRTWRHKCSHHIRTRIRYWLRYGNRLRDWYWYFLNVDLWWRLYWHGDWYFMNLWYGDWLRNSHRHL